MSLQSLNTSVYLILALLSVILTESEGTRRSIKNQESIRNEIEELDVPNDSGSLKIESDFGPSLNETGRNSPALNSFLKNVLQAQDELKWIDQAVRRVDARDNPEKVPYRYLRSSFHTPASIYNTRIRFKRRSDPRSYDDEDPWTSTKSRYIYDDHNSDRIYLDNEMKVKKRQAKYPYQEFDYSGYRPSRRRYIGRSAVDDNGEPIDDSTLKNWAKKEGLQVPVDWFDSGQSNGEKLYETSGNHYNWPKNDYDDELRDAEGSNVRMNDFNRNVNDWVDNTRDERDAGHPLIRQEAEQPTLESLKKTVLELKKSLENSDKNINAIDEKEGDFSVAKNREKYISDISGIKKSDDNSPYDQGSNFYDEIDREYRDDPVSSKTDISGGSNWWEDPRSAIDMFEFKKRDDDAEDEDDDEESAPGNSEFDYMMPRVKREKYDDDDENGEKNIVRVYRRAGFGELYHKNEKTEGENAEEINKVGRVQREIREAEGIDKINDERNTDGVKTGKNERVDINENENENENGNYLREFSEEIKNFGKDNPAKKSAVLKAGENEMVEKVTGTFGDRNLKEENNAGFISGDEKRSSSLRDREEKNEPRFSADYSSQENIKSRLNEPNIKSVKISVKEVDKNEVEKSEPNDDDVHKLSQDLNGDEKREKENKSDDKKAGIKSVNEIIKGDSSGEINDDNHKENEPEFTNSNDDKALNHEHENNAQSSQDLETVKLVRPENLKVEIKNPDQEEKKNEKDVASDSKESSDELGKNKEHKQEENYQAKELIGYNDKDKDNEKYEKSSETNSGSYHRDKVADELDEKNLDTKLKNAVLKREDLTRKLLWVSDESEAELKGNGRRESAWYKNRGEKSVERQAGFLKNIQALLGFDNNSDESKFVKRSLMAAEDNIAKADQNSVDPGYRGLKKREGIRFSKTDTDYEPCDTSDSEFSERSKRLEKRSSESHPENFYGYKKNALNLESRDQSVKKIVPPDLTEYGSEIEGYNLPQDDEDFRDNSAVKNDDDENQVESDIRFSDQDRDRDPMRDRINMLIKEKLEDRGKGKLMHFKREIDNRGENIEYYDYESGVNGVESDVDSTVVENDPKIRDDDNNNNNNCSYPEVAIDKAPETMTKKDENKEEERKEELEQEERNHKAPKEEFISDVELGKNVKKKPTFSKINAGLESGDKTYRRLKDNNFQESNTNSNSHWLGQPAEADTDQEIESLDRRGRYREIGESGKEEKSLENDKAEVFGEPLEYSVKVHGKLDPESIDTILNDNENAKDKELGDNDKLQIGTDRDWKYEGIRGKSRSRSGQRIGDYQFGRDQEIGDKSLASNFQYGENSARIEEGTNDRASIRNSINYDRIIKDESLYGNGDNRPSLEARLVDDSDQDTLPTMIDRSETRNLAPGEKTYLVIAPPRIQYPEKSSENKNSSSSSSSGSNYLALKITDDMFKGGIEQSNPTEDKIPDNNLMGKTTTEWKVIKMFEDGGSKPQNFALNPRDDVHESIVDPEEMIGDFDDDMRPGFGRDLKCLRKSHRHFARNLQSVSYPIDPFGQGDRSLDINGGEEPVDKYLKYSQKGFEKSETTGHRIKKRSVVLIDGKKADENFNEDQKISGLDSEIKNFTGVDKNLEKRFSGVETSDGANYTEIDKDKRGLTNVEEWEMNAPTVQKQLKNIETLSDNIGEKYNSDGKISEEKNTAKISSSNSDDSVTSGSHDREIRSVKFKDENSKFDSFPASRESLYFNKMRSKIREKDKLRASKLVSRTKPFAKYVSSLDSNSQYNYDERNLKNDENYETSYDHDWKKLNPEENDEGKVRQLNTNDYWRVNQGRSKSEKEQRNDEPNHRPYQHNELEKDSNVRNSGHGIRESLRDYNDPKTQLKTTKGHGERNFKDVEGASAIQNAKAHDKMSTHVMDSSQNKSSQGGERYDKENATERDKKVLEENAEDPVKPLPEVDEKQKKKFTVLLAADNMEDESQMDLALHGELAGKIVETIFDQVQKNDALKVALGPGLYRKHKSEDVVATDKIYRQGLDEDEVKHTEGMMRRVMELLGRLILDEVQRKTCASLPPDMKEFLQWMLGVEDDDKATDQIAPFPFVHDEEPNQRKEEKFLFENPSMRKENADVVELNKKVKLLRSLINEYNSLSDREKTKVQSVHDYLVRQLGLLIKYIDAKVAEGGENLKTGRIGGGNILQYQNAVPNSNGTEVTESTLSPLVNTPSIMMLSNASFVEEPKAAFNHFVRSRFRETRSSGEKVEKTGKKRKHGKQKQPNDQERDQRKHKRKHKKKKKNKNKKNKKNKNKNKKKHQKQKGAQSPEYKKLIRRAAMLRKKRANIYGDNWDPIDSGYEEPMIYTSNGELTNKLKRSIWKQRLDDDEERNPKYWADVLSGKLDDEIIDDRDAPGFEKDLNFDTKIPDDTKNSSSSKEIKRDVIGTSIALQPWLNPRIDDLVSSNYLKELTNELVQGSVAPPIYPGDKIDGVRNVELKMTEEENIVNDELPMLSKRDVWKNENEEQLEEVAFGKDMRGKWKEKEQFKKLTEMDRKKNLDIGSGKRRKRDGDMIGNNSTSENNDAILNEGIKSDDFKTPVKLEVNKKNETVVSTDFENSNTLSIEEHNSVTEKIEKDERSLKNKDFLELLKNGDDKGIASGMSKSDVNYRRDTDTKTYEKLNEKRSSPLLLPETEESAILPLLEISEQRQEQKQAGKTHNDDQRDIADQMLGFESPLITGLINTY